MKEYLVKLKKTHLQKEPDKYAIPEKTCVADYKILEPTLKSVRVYKYPYEHSVVLEGNNLWFCHEIQLGEGENVLHIKNSAQNITGRSVQFNCPPAKESDQLMGKDGKMRVILHSHFAESMEKRIKVEEVRCNISNYVDYFNSNTEMTTAAELIGMAGKSPESNAFS